ncbi:MAG: cation:proton antiporter [Ilumatobacteraceae bacterium]
MHIDVALIELGVIMLTLAVVGRIAARIGLPTIPLFLLAGLFFCDGGVFPVTEARDFVEVGSSLGVVFLLFMLGLEYTPVELRQSLRRNAPVGVLDIVFKATPGVVAAALILGWGPLAAAVLGGITYISSTGIVAKLLIDLKRLGNRETPTVLSVLVLEDLVMAIFLPVIAVLLASGSVTSGVISGVAAVLIVGAVLQFSPYATSHVNRLVDSHSAELLLFTLLGLATVVAGLAERANVSYAIGAFLLGIVLSGQVAERAREMLVPLRDAFAALFFVNFGLGIDPASLLSVAGPAGALVAVGVVSKFATGWIAARRAGSAIAGARRAGVTLIARGEFSIVLAGIGVAGGITSDLGTLTMAYVLGLAIVGSLATRLMR